MQTLDRELTETELAQILAAARKTTAAAIASLLDSRDIAPKRDPRELYLEAGFEIEGHELYRAAGVRTASPPIYLSHSEANHDALIIRPIAWHTASDGGEELRDLLLDSPRIPTGSYALARVENRDLIIYLEHLPTQQLDPSELRAVLNSARLAGFRRGVDDLPTEDGWFDRSRAQSPVDQIDQFLLGRPTGWSRAPEFSNENAAWIRNGEAPMAVYLEPEAGILVIARALRSFLGMPPLETAGRLLRNNMQLLDGGIAAVRDGAQGSFVMLQRLCCDDLDDIELQRSVSYVERLRIRSNTEGRSALQLLGMVRRCSIERPETKDAIEPPAQTQRKQWPTEIHLGSRQSGDALDLPVTDMLTHAFVCGGSGSGKTIVCKNMIEELAAAGVPAIVVDLKGDLSSLGCVPPSPTIEDISRYLVRLHGTAANHMDGEIAQQATETHDLYSGAGIDKEELNEFRDQIRYRILTPRSDVGIPLALSPLARVELESFAESGGIMGNRALHELVDGNLRSLVDHIGLGDSDADTLIAVLIQLLESACREGLPLSGIEGVETLVRLLFEVHDRAEMINFLPTEDAIDPKQAESYARAMNARLGGTFRYWFDGESLSIDELISTADGRVPINIINLSMLPGNADVLYAVAQINAQIIEWMRRQPGAQRPRLLYCIDEIAQEGGKGAIYPPHPYNPISKSGLGVLLKQGRAFGVSCLLATQNAKDIDYKGLGQCDTWVIGRLKTEKDIERLGHGLESAQMDATHSFDDKIDDIMSHVGGLSPGNFVIKTRSNGVISYKQRWIRSIHDRLTPEMLRNWVQAEELAIEARVSTASEAWNRGKVEHAIAALEEIITQEPYFSRLAETKLLLCEWLFRSKQWARVAEYADELRNTVPARNGFELLHYYEGMAHYEMEAFGQARRALQRFVSVAGAGSDELAERCRERLKDLFVAQDDFAALEEEITNQVEGTPGRSKLLTFCRSMREALVGWPSLRGHLDDATVLQSRPGGDHNEIRYVQKKGERDIHAYVAEVRRHLDDLSFSAPEIGGISESEAEALKQVSLQISLGEDQRITAQERIGDVLAEAEGRIDERLFGDASDLIDQARKLVNESGIGVEDLAQVISMYRGASSAERDGLREWFMNLDPFKFELEVAALFRALGYDAQATKKTGDGGVDVFARQQNLKYVIQCKRYRHPIDPGQIREFATVVRNFDADKGIFVTTSRFTDGCRKEAQQHDIRLIDLDQLIRLYREAQAEGSSTTGSQLGERADATACKNAILRALSMATGPLLIREIADQADMSVPICREAIKVLNAEGLIEKHGKGRGVRYTAHR